MQTTALTLTTDWTELSSGAHTCIFDVQSAGTVIVHLSESATPPASDAPGVEVQSWPAAFDFAMTGMSGSQHVWARAKSGAVPVVVIV